MIALKILSEKRVTNECIASRKNKTYIICRWTNSKIKRKWCDF